MRIGFVSTYPPIECGIATYTSYLNETLRKVGNETFVVSPLGAQGIGVFPIYRPESTSMPKQIFDISAEFTPDIIHIQHEYGLYGPQRGVHVIGLISCISSQAHRLSQHCIPFRRRLIMQKSPCCV